MVNLTTSLGKLILKNPVLVASGTFGYGLEYQDIVGIEKLGALVLKTITLKPREGNSPPRIWETPSGMLNAIGLQNVGIDNFLDTKLPLLKKFDVPLIINIAGETIDEYIELANRLDGVNEIAAIELNVSCPNVRPVGNGISNGVKKAVMRFGEDAGLLAELVKAVRRATKKNLITKLTPNVTDITAIAKSAEGAGSDVLSLVNTFLGMAIDTNSRRPRLGYTTGGLSGPAIRPIAVRMVWQVAKAVKVPVIGMGGIASLEDALEFIIAGAAAISIGTANFINPKAALEIIDGLGRYMEKNNIK
ncbi:MAG: dihydroorotate dehydrogenase, partial [Candidatus Omnitrophica bacterium]|nr:dihydroorotate dehydrogenase [Candidatus Omnitrophota bacterium]